MRISDWSSDVCSSDLIFFLIPGVQILGVALLALPFRANIPIGAAMTFLSNPVTTPFIIAASVWLGDRMFGLHANVATFSVMISVRNSRNRSVERRLGKSVSVRVDLGGRRNIKKKHINKQRARLS